MAPAMMSLPNLRFLWLWIFLFKAMDTSNAFTVLDVGAPRTGTQSMYDVMKILGLNPLHSGYRHRVRAPLCYYLFGNGSLDEALGTLEGFDAAMDEPFMLMYEEIMSAFPESKFLLTISDGESWFKNYVELMSKMNEVNEVEALKNFTEAIRTRNVSVDFPDVCTAMRSWGCDFQKNSSAEAKDLCLKNYHRHNERVQRVIPPQRLLVYNWADGWAPLCHFLGKPIPDVAFPHEDLVMTKLTTAEMAIDSIQQALG